MYYLYYFLLLCLHHQTYRLILKNLKIQMNHLTHLFHHHLMYLMNLRYYLILIDLRHLKYLKNPLNLMLHLKH